MYIIKYFHSPSFEPAALLKLENTQTHNLPLHYITIINLVLLQLYMYIMLTNYYIKVLVQIMALCFYNY
jgi:hypothetical protein